MRQPAAQNLIVRSRIMQNLIMWSQATQDPAT